MHQHSERGCRRIAITDNEEQFRAHTVSIQQNESENDGVQYASGNIPKAFIFAGEAAFHMNVSNLSSINTSEA